MSGVASLPLFDATATCPKCGHDSVRVAHHREWSRHCPLGRLTTPPLAQGEYDRWLKAWDREHFDRTCARCGFGWAERVGEGGAMSEPAAT